MDFPSRDNMVDFPIFLERQRLSFHHYKRQPGGFSTIIRKENVGFSTITRDNLVGSPSLQETTLWNLQHCKRQLGGFSIITRDNLVDFPPLQRTTNLIFHHHKRQLGCFSFITKDAAWWIFQHCITLPIYFPLNIFVLDTNHYIVHYFSSRFYWVWGRTLRVERRRRTAWKGKVYIWQPAYIPTYFFCRTYLTLYMDGILIFWILRWSTAIWIVE